VLKKRQFGSASGTGLKDDARALEKEVKALQVEIESRQDLLTTADGVAPGVKELESLIGDLLKGMEADRVRNDRRMADMMKELASSAPAAGSLPAEQKAFAEQLEKRQAELNKARERYAAAADAAQVEADGQVKELEAELAAAQAKVDERRKQTAEAAKGTLTAQQQRERAAQIEARRRELAAAQKADQAAADAYAMNHKAILDASGELDAVKRRVELAERENAKGRDLEREIAALNAEYERLTQRSAAAVVPLEPLEADVSYNVATTDRRAIIFGTCLVIAIGFFFLVHFAPLHPEQPADEHDDDDEFAARVAYPTDAFAPALAAIHPHGHAASNGNGNGAADPAFTADAGDPDQPALAAADAVEDATARARQTGRAPGAESAVPV
jgi:hypothetical protein